MTKSAKQSTSFYSRRVRGRSVAAVLALVGWWLAVILAGWAWQLLNSGNQALVQPGTWLVGFTGLATVIGWGGTVGSLLNDRGRIRAGVICLMALPFVGIGFSYPILHTTVIGGADPILAAWLVVSAIFLLLGTALIVAPMSEAEKAANSRPPRFRRG